MLVRPRDLADRMFDDVAALVCSALKSGFTPIIEWRSDGQIELAIWRFPASD
jgi:hypothetical protein